MKISRILSIIMVFLMGTTTKVCAQLETGRLMCDM